MTKKTNVVIVRADFAGEEGMYVNGKLHKTSVRFTQTEIMTEVLLLGDCGTLTFDYKLYNNLIFDMYNEFPKNLYEVIFA